MAFSVVIIILLGVIGYFHYVQGLLSSVISLVCAILAAMLTLSYHEKVVAMAFASKMTDQGHAITLCGMFLIIYLILRIVIDGIVPGNIRFPAIVDKSGGAILGVIAGAFALGIFAIAAQTLPFGPSIAGYGRFKMESQRDVKIPTGRGPFQDSYTFDELKSETLTAEDSDSMIIPVDDFVIGAIKKFSDGGSLEGDRTFASVHPAYIDEMFFNRLGIQFGARHVAVNTDKQQMFTVQNIYSADALNKVEAEIPEIRAAKDNKPVKSDQARLLIVVRAQFADSASDSDHLVRLAPSAVRLVANSNNYHPIGTLENGGLYANKADDYMFVHSGQNVDFVFLVPREDVLTRSAAPAKSDKNTPAAATVASEIKDGVFIEAKRMARVDLSGMTVTPGVPVEPSSGVLRKNNLPHPEPMAGGIVAPSATPTPAPAGGTPSAAAPPAAAPSGAVPIKFVSAAAGAKLLSDINIGTHGADEADLKFKSGTAAVKEGKLSKIELHAVDALEELAKGDDKVSELYAPSGTHVVQVTADATSEPWAWADSLADFEVVDGSGITYKPNGAIAKATKGGKDYLIGKYNADEAVEKMDKEEGATPTRITIIFLIPDSTPLKTLNFKGQKVADLRVE